MKANYNKWFYEYNKYLAQQGKDAEYNDTRYVDIVNRLKPLIDINSSLLSEQPFGVVANNRGLDHLIDLLSKSSYTFEDIDQSLIETYKTTLQASMSNMLVNTHAIMFSCTSSNKRYVTYDNLTRTYILDIPFIQLHFGDRDEFIRQKIEKMHTRAKDNYVSLQSFVSNDIESLLGFSIMCTVNGYICNECEIAIDDMGFKFRIKWSGATNENDTGELNFIIYKLDTVRTHLIQVSQADINSGYIPLNRFGLADGTFRDKKSKCLIDIYCERTKSTSRTVPNFGVLDNNGLQILELQKHTSDDVEINGSNSIINMIVYEIEYLHEIPNVFPAANYYNVLDSRRVYTERKDGVIDVYQKENDVENLRIVSSSDYSSTKIPVCTPPIAIDRDASSSFKTLSSCAELHNKMMSIASDVYRIGDILIGGKDNARKRFADLVSALYKVKAVVTECFVTYSKGALLTNLTGSSTTEKFKAFIDNIDALLQLNPNQITGWDMVYTLKQPEHGGYYDRTSYTEFVNEMAGPFKSDLFKRLSELTNNFFRDSNPRRFKRPVAEQCFITLQYDPRTSAWIFANPHIEHFKGIGNTFYIKNGLTGKEIFKFFVLYTDTNSPSELTAEPLSLETVYDFDKFYDEVLLHMGYIKYWAAENKLMKLSKILYGAYDDETIVQVLSKILAGTISVDDLLTTYGSELKYDEAGETTTAWNPVNRRSEYDEDSLAAPFTINYLFYTIQMMRDNGDQFEPLFMRALLEKNHSKRYQDINIADSIDKTTTVPICFSQYSIAPSDIDKETSNTPVGSSVFYGIPYALSSKIVKTENPYLKTFNIYENNRHYPFISPNEIISNEYVSWSDVSLYGGKTVKFSYDIEVAKLVTKYLSYTYTSISDIETNYDKTYDVRYLIKDYNDTIQSVITPLLKLTDKYVDDFNNPKTYDIVVAVVNNPIKHHFDTLSRKIETLNAMANGTGSIRKTFDSLTTFLRKMQKEVGFPLAFTRRINKLYKQLKKFDSKMNIYELKQWWNDFDIESLMNLETITDHEETGIDKNVISEDKYISRFISDIKYYVKRINDYIKQVIEPIDDEDSVIDSILNMMREQLVHVHWEEHFSVLSEYCKDVFLTNIFDLYTIGDVTQWANTSDTDKFQTTMPTKPYYASLKLDDPEHLKSPVDEDTTTSYALTFYVDTTPSDKINGVWKINEFIPMAEYCFFDGKPIIDKAMTVYDVSGNVIGTIRVNISFTRVGSTAGKDDIINIIPSISTTTIQFDNEHEDMTVDSNRYSNSLVSNKKTHDMHFELLFGNRYIPLDHDCEYVLDPNTFEEHSRDIVRVPNKMINSLMIGNTNGLANPRMHFKPTQVYHLPKDAENCITSVYGKCFVGQTVYCATDDGLSVFPIRITAIDHSPSHGFVEAEVESVNAKWFATVDPEVISKYLFEDIHCHIIPDNMMNILKEYNHSGYYHYNIPDNDSNATSPESLPGDPLYVTNNANYVHTRLDYMFHDAIPNRFISEQTKNWKYMYLGEVVGKLGHNISSPVEPPVEDTSILPARYTSMAYIETAGNSMILLDSPYDANTEIFMDFELHEPSTYLKEIFLAGNLTTGVAFGERIYWVNKNRWSNELQGHWVDQPFRNSSKAFAQSGYLAEGTVQIGRSYIYINSRGIPSRLGYSSNNPKDDYTTTYWDYDEITKSNYPNYTYGNAEDIPAGEGPIGIFGSYGIPGDTLETSFRDDNLFGMASPGSKLYIVIVRNKGEMTHCLLPCIDTETGEAGMFCIITRRFYGSATEVPFIPGPMVEFTPWEEISNLFESMSSNPGSSDNETENGDDSEIDLTHDFTINLINREIHDVTDPELYQTLREEPDDHDVWKNEIKEFNRVIEEELGPRLTGFEHDLYYAEMTMNNATDAWSYKRAVISVEGLKQKIKDTKDRMNQIKHYTEQLESPTTWFNVGSYDAAMVYINNGRSILDPSVIVDKIDVPITNRINVFLYDWEHKKWIDPSTYTISTVTETISTDAKEDYYTRNVVTKMIVTSEQGFTSGDILVYLAYNKSDVYDSIPINDNSFDVKFKPIISTAKANTVPPYSVINLRKHFDGFEEYVFSDYNAKDIGFNASDEPTQNGFYIKRVKTSGKFMDTPILRLKDIHFTPERFSIYKRLPFKNIHTPMGGYEPSYTAFVNVKIDKFVPGERVRLICIENSTDRSFDGTISNIMFDGITSIENNMQTITIVNSTLESFISGEYYCTVFQSNDYKSYGGIINVRVNANKEYEMDASNEWVKIPINDKTRHMPIPDEFVLVPDQSQTVTFNATITISSDYKLYEKAAHNQVNKNLIDEDNMGDSPYRFYYNNADHIRYPLSDVRTGKIDKRLIIDSINEYVDGEYSTNQKELRVGHMTYIGIPRYSSAKIPENGVFDVTGYIPTPLSRDRYEWWVNGRFINGDDVVILSPTSFQLKNLQSLKNFELVELVEDKNNSEIIREGNVYTDIHGNTYGSYKLALLSGNAMINQDIKYVFNTSNHKSIQDYTRGISGDPKNIDIEDDIFDSLEHSLMSSDDEKVKYNELYNLPSINGVTVYNMKSGNFGINEISLDELAVMLDKVWKKEITTNSLFVTSHRSSSNNDHELILHKKPANTVGISDNRVFVAYASGLMDRYFTLYITTDPTKKIHNTSSTQKIIPFIKVGTYVVLDKKYQGMWLCCSEPNVKPIKL